MTLDYTEASPSLERHCILNNLLFLMMFDPMCVLGSTALPSVLDSHTSNTHRGRPGFDGGYKARQGMSRLSYLVNPTENNTNANDERYALAA